MESGTRLGPYEISARLGAGGMGEVWAAKDTRLERSVAIKVLPAEYAHDAQLRLRFEREAKTISQLNHPNICTLFDVGRENGIDYLVMELLDGETLADRVARGPLPLAEVLRHGSAIAEALGRAHRSGIVHRDLKPANVMLTRGGVKLLDFGLAKSASPPVSLDDATRQKGLTQEGTILGTFQYMAPEQLEGAEADARTDIFALGALLYEMASGRRAFEGKTKTSLIAAIVGAQPPPLTQIQPLTPPALEHVIAKCLKKDPDDRWQSAHDVAEELRWIGEAGSQAGVAAPVIAARTLRRRMGLVATVLLAFVAAAAVFMNLRLRDRLARAERPLAADVVPPPGVELGPAVIGPIALAPAGTKLAYIGRKGGQPGLWIHDLATGDSRAVPEIQAPAFPFWSPDGKHIAFFDQGKLKRVAVDGGQPQVICDAQEGRGGTWNRNDVIVFTPNIRSPLFRVDATGGTPVQLTNVGPLVTHRLPYFLPDGNHYLYVERDTSGAMGTGKVMAGRLDDPKLQRQVLATASNVAFAGGMLLFYRDGSLVAQRFDPRKLIVEGPYRTIAQRLDYYNPRDLAAFTASEDGRLVYAPANTPLTQIVVLDAAGRELATVGDPAYQELADVSADGRSVAVVRAAAGSTERDLWTLDIERGVATRVTFLSTKSEMDAAFSPDGQSLAIDTFGSANSRTRSTAWVQSLGASGTERALASSKLPVTLQDWSPDGRMIVGTIQQSETGHDIAVVAADGDGKIVPILQGKYEEDVPRVSPDGKWILYRSNESGSGKIFVTTFPQPGRKWQVSTLTSIGAIWSRDGSKVILVSGDKTYGVSVKHVDGRLEFGTPAELPFSSSTRIFDELPNGRWLAARPVTDGRAPALKLMVNWMALAER